MPRPSASPPIQIEIIATATPNHDVHQAFIDWASPRITDTRTRKLFKRMVDRSGIGHRWSVLPPTGAGGSPVDAGGFYDALPLPPTSARMVAYARYAPQLALAAIAKLDFDPARITHLVVASCTGFVAPGIDQIIAGKLGLSSHVERTLIGFMGCYAGITALRTARHIVRSEPKSVVLLISVELSTLHLDDQSAIEPLLAMLQFSDGAAAAIISSAPGPVAIGAGLSLAIQESEELIRWDIGDHGFVMHLSGAVPGRIEAALTKPENHDALFPGGIPAYLAIHAGGRSILDAVERALDLPSDALADSRATLRDFGNMSSATILFTIERLMQRKLSGSGLALAFGPGLAAEAVGLTFAP
ncbi:MAG: type III polyketide synthase [Sphingopyxis sp.]